MFVLDPRLVSDTIVVGDFRLCRLLLMNDSSYPWFILVPRREAVCEIFELNGKDQQQLLVETTHLSKVMQRVFAADKMNIASLGNLVPQLHIHHVARYYADQAWPKPIWGLHAPQAYTNRALQNVCANLIQHLEDFTPDKDCPESSRVCC